MFNSIEERQMAFGFGIGAIMTNLPITSSATIEEWERHYVFGSYLSGSGSGRIFDFAPFFGE